MEFIGRQDTLTELLAFARAETPNPQHGLVIVGPAGIGKSALLTKLYQQLKNFPELILLTTPTSSKKLARSAEYILRYWISELAKILKLPNDPIPEYAAWVYLTEILTNLIGTVTQQQSVVLLLNAAEQLATNPATQNWEWLPPLNSKVRLVITSLPDTAQSILNLYPEQLIKFELPPLTNEAATTLAQAIYAHNERVFAPELIQILFTKPDVSVPAYGNPQWVILAVEELIFLQDRHLATTSTTDATAEQTENSQKILTEQILALPNTVAELYSLLLNRSAQIAHNAIVARIFAQLLATSRYGLRATDFAVLMPKLTEQEWTDTTFVHLRHAYRNHLLQREELGLWDTAHWQLRLNIAELWLTDATVKRNLHGWIATYLQSLPSDDPVRCSETAYHLVELENAGRLFTYLATLVTEHKHKELQGAATTLAILLHADAKTASGNEVAEWLTSNLEQLFADSKSIPALANFFLITLDAHLQQQRFIHKPRQKILIALQALLAHRIAANPDDIQTLHNLSITDNKLGDFYSLRNAQGDTERALAAYSSALKIREHLYQNNYKDTQLARNLSLAQEKLGDLYWRRKAVGDLELAFVAYSACLEIDNRLHRAHPKNIQAARDLSVTHNKLGDVYLQRNTKADLRRALAAYNASLKIRKWLHRLTPKNPQAIRDLAVIYQKLGNLYLRRGSHKDLRQALSAYQAGLELIGLAYQNNQNNPNLIRDLSRSQHKLGEFYSRRNEKGDVQRALAAYSSCYEILDRLTQDNPKDLQAARNLAVSLNKLGDLYTQCSEPGDTEQILASYNNGLDIVRGLYQLNPHSLEAARDLSFAYNKLGDFYLHRNEPGDEEQAFSAYTAGLEMRERFHKIYPNFMQAAWDVAVSYWKMATISTDNLNKAQKWWERCHQQLTYIARQKSLAPHYKKYLQYAASQASTALVTKKVAKTQPLQPKPRKTTANADPLRFAKRIAAMLLLIIWIMAAGSLVWLKDPQLFTMAERQIYATTALWIPSATNFIQNIDFKSILVATSNNVQQTWSSLQPVLLELETVTKPLSTINFTAIWTQISQSTWQMWITLKTLAMPSWQYVNENLYSQPIWNQTSQYVQQVWANVKLPSVPSWEYVISSFNIQPIWNQTSQYVQQTWTNVKLFTMTHWQYVTETFNPQPIWNQTSQYIQQAWTNVKFFTITHWQYITNKLNYQVIWNQTAQYVQQTWTNVKFFTIIRWQYVNNNLRIQHMWIQTSQYAQKTWLNIKLFTIIRWQYVNKNLHIQHMWAQTSQYVQRTWANFKLPTLPSWKYMTNPANFKPMLTQASQYLSQMWLRLINIKFQDITSIFDSQPSIKKPRPLPVLKPKVLSKQGLKPKLLPPRMLKPLLPGQLPHKPLVARPLLPKPVATKSPLSNQLAPKPPLPKPVMPRPLLPKPVAPKPPLPNQLTPKPPLPKPVMPRPLLPKPLAPKPPLSNQLAPKPPLPKPVMPRPLLPKPVAPKSPLSNQLASKPPLPKSVMPRPLLPKPVATKPPLSNSLVPKPPLPKPVMPRPLLPKPVITRPPLPNPLIPRPQSPQATAPQ